MTGLMDCCLSRTPFQHKRWCRYWVAPTTATPTITNTVSFPGATFTIFPSDYQRDLARRTIR